jgi:hypothetical protein
MAQTCYSIKSIEYGCIINTGQRAIKSRQTAVGTVGALGTLQLYFVFDVAAIQGDISRATLQLELEAYLSVASSETLTISRAYLPTQDNVSQSVVNPATGQTFVPEIDKQTIYSRATLQPGDAGHAVTLRLLPQALRDMQTSANGRFIIGLTLLGPTGEKADPGQLRLLRFRTDTTAATPQLVVEAQAAQGLAKPQQRYGLQYDISDTAIPTQLQSIINSQATTLEVMLQSFQDSARHLRNRNDMTEEQRTSSLDTLVKETQDGLAALAQKHVLVEQRIGEAQTNDDHTLALSPEHAELLRALERVNSVLHANISLARKHLKTIMHT